MSIAKVSDSLKMTDQEFDRFTESYELEINPYSHLKVKVDIDPTVYERDWEKPYKDHLDNYVCCNDSSLKNQKILRNAIFLNDKRYENSDFKISQVKRQFSGKIDMKSPENYWICYFCEKEIREYLLSNPKLSDIRTLVIILKESAAKEELVEFRKRILEFRKKIFDSLNPFSRTLIKITEFTSEINNKILDYAGNADDPGDQRSRTIANHCINVAYLATSIFIFKYYITSSLNSSSEK